MGPNWTYAEGFILGVGAKIFTIAGSVTVYGTVASTYLPDHNLILNKRLDQIGQAFFSICNFGSSLKS